MFVGFQSYMIPPSDSDIEHLSILTLYIIVFPSPFQLLHLSKAWLGEVIFKDI